MGGGGGGDRDKITPTQIRINKLYVRAPHKLNKIFLFLVFSLILFAIKNWFVFQCIAPNPFAAKNSSTFRVLSWFPFLVANIIAWISNRRQQSSFVKSSNSIIKGRNKFPYLTHYSYCHYNYKVIMITLYTNSMSKV